MENPLKEPASVTLDFATSQALTARLRDERDSFLDVIRRLLGLPDVNPASGEVPVAQPATWTAGSGVSLPVGTRLRGVVKGREHFGIVRADGVEVAGEVFDSLSSAGQRATGRSTNGWVFWQIEDPGTRTWKLLTTLRN